MEYISNWSAVRAMQYLSAKSYNQSACEWFDSGDEAAFNLIYDSSQWLHNDSLPAWACAGDRVGWRDQL
jgi:hypothetical protein